MGCGPSKPKKSEIKRIDYDLSATYTLQMDQEVKECLKNIEQLRSDVEDSRENLMKDTYSIYLKAPCLEEALRILFWCISANAKGDIQECQPELETSPPYLTMHLPTDTRSEVLQLWKYFTKYLDAIKNGPQIIQTEIENYEKYLEECNEFVENGLEDVLSVHETQLQKTQAALNISRNITKIQDQASAVKRVKEIVEEARKEAESITDFIQELIQTADEVGLKAFNEGLFTPDEICLHYHPQLTKDAGDHDFQKNLLTRQIIMQGDTSEKFTLESAEQLYTVEKILERATTEDGKKYYRIKWKGYPASQATWEPVENLLAATDLLFDFETRCGSQNDCKPRKREKPQKRYADQSLSHEEEEPKKKIKREKLTKESQKKKQVKKGAIEKLGKKKQEKPKKIGTSNKIVEKDTSNNVPIFANDNDNEEGFNIVEILEEELEPEITHGTVIIKDESNPVFVKADEEEGTSSNRIFPPRKGSLSSGDQPQMVLKAETLSDDKYRFLVSWELDSNGVLPEPSYVTNRQLKNSHPVFLVEYYEKLVFQHNLIKRF